MDNKYFLQIKNIINSDISNDDKYEKLLDYHDNDIANVIENLDKNDRLKLYKVLGIDRLSSIFSYFDNQNAFIHELDYEVAASIIGKMDSDDAVDILDELDEDDRLKIYKLLDLESKKDIALINSYEDEAIGSKMTTNFISIPINSTVKSAMKSLITQAAENDNIQNIFVVDKTNHLKGVVDLKDLIIARTDTLFEDIIKTNYPYVLDEALIDDSLNEIIDYDMDVIPVVNKEKILVGVITSSDLIESVDDQLSEDYAKFAGLTEEEDSNEKIINSVKKRMPWLIVLMIFGIVVSSVTSEFEGVIAALPAIVFFQSMVLDMAGNVGTQSLAVTIRVISDEDNSKHKALKLILHEVRVGFINGLFLGILTGTIVLIYLGITKTVIETGTVFSWYECTKAGCIVGFALLISMTLSSITGSVLPIILNKMHIDPAVASGPFITTINDLIAISIYYSLAFLLFLVL